MDDAQIQALTDLYRLDQVSAPTQRSFLSVLVYFGVLLVGLGVLSFVAANWEFIPTALKVALLLGAMWGAQGSGFYLERSGKSPALGHGLIVLGSLLYGANIGLFGQIFQLQGELYQALFLWGIGVLAVAYALPSLPNAALALVVLLGGYLDWSWGSNSGTVLPLLPVLGLALCLPLSYRLRSPGFYQWTVLLAGIGFLVESFRAFSLFNGGSLLPQVVLALLVSLWLWVVASLPVTFFGAQSGRLSRGVAFWTIASIGYLFSFFGVTDSLHDASSGGKLDWNQFLAQPMVLFLIVTTLAGAFWLVRRGIEGPMLEQATVMGICCVGVLALVAVHFDPLLAVLWMNAILLGVAAYLIRLGLKGAERRSFLLGSGLCAWLALSRFFEYETGLLVKSVAFVVVGVAVIGVAIWFEKYLNRQEKPSNA